jgi:hypothetical protein
MAAAVKGMAPSEQGYAMLQLGARPALLLLLLLPAICRHTQVTQRSHLLLKWRGLFALNIATQPACCGPQGLLGKMVGRVGGSAHGGRMFSRSPSAQQLSLLVCWYHCHGCRGKTSSSRYQLDVQLLAGPACAAPQARWL